MVPPTSGAADVDASRAADVNAAVRGLAVAHRARMSALLGRYGVSIGQELLLLELDEKEPCTQAELAAAAHCEASTITVAVRKLEGVGLVRRNRSPSDARAVAVELTPEGRDVVPFLRSAQTAVAAELLSGLPAGLDEASFVAILEAVTQSLRSMPRN